MLKFNRKIHKSVSDGNVVEVSELDGIRSLHIGSVTIQSSMRVRDPNYLELNYTRAMMCFLLFIDAPKHLLTLGLGGGSITKYLHAYTPIQQTVIEINPQVIAIARSHFAVPEDNEKLRILCLDGTEYVRQHPKGCDVLLLDVFDSEGVPEDCVAPSFFDACNRALSAEGVLMMNLWGSDKRFDIYMQRIEAAFDGNVLMLPTGSPGNIIVFALKGEQANPSVLRSRALALQKQFTEIEFSQFAEVLLDKNPSQFFMTERRRGS